jgi:hypothetical protein
VGSEDAVKAFVLGPFVRILVGDVFVVLSGGDGDRVAGAVGGEGVGGRVARSSGAWTC